MTELERIQEITKAKLDIAAFNEMQLKAFEVIPKQSDTLLLSKTGSGKTLAFLLPIMSSIDSTLNMTQSLIITPTRELALQITTVAKSLGLGFNIQCCYGGNPSRLEKKALLSNPTLIIGTPGRILDHLERNNINSDHLKFLVLDEFDKTLEMGFHKQMEGIIRKLQVRPQHILTSATDSIVIPSFVPLKNLIKVDFLGTQEKINIDIKKVISPVKDKLETLYNLLNDIAHESTLVFCNYRETVERTSKFLFSKDIENDVFHGGLDQINRENVLSKFRNGTTRLLITTDLAGRGLDIPEVANVVHYHHPTSEEVYIHRNGRTARMNTKGKVFIIESIEEKSPSYMETLTSEYMPSEVMNEIPKSQWTTLLINKGKRDKINKIDVVGFLIKIGGLEKNQLGLIEVKQGYSIAAVNESKASKVVQKTDRQKVKGKKVLVRILD